MRIAITLILIVLHGYLGYSQTTTSKIDITESIRISNSNQVIRIKGDNLQNPVLLYINGGPGDSVLAQMDKMFGALQQHFTVVLWDQRKTGKTLNIKNTEVKLSQKLFKDDTYQLIQYLLQKFIKRKIVLVAHSYGTSLGFHIVKNHPELLHAFVAINPLVNQIESERLTLKMLKEHAKKHKNNKALKELSKVSIPFKTGEELYYARKWLFDFEEKRFAKKKSFKKYVLSWAETWLPIFNEASQENLFQSLKKINCPVFFITGENDFQTNSKLTQNYYNLLQTTQKEFFIIENAGHLIPYDYREEFQKIIIDNVISALPVKEN